MVESKTPADVWADYLLNRKIEYLDTYRRDIGREYNSNAGWWDALAEREWEVIEERLKTGFGVEQAIKQQLGEDFFERLNSFEKDINMTRIHLNKTASD